MNFSATEIFKVFVLSIVIILIISAGNEEVEARKRKKGNRGKGKRKGRKHRNRRRDMKDSESDAINQAGLPEEMHLLSLMKQQRSSKASPTASKSGNSEADVWTEAILSVRSENSVYPTNFMKGKFGYHSKSTSVTGKVVHVEDLNMKTHYGCSNGIGNYKVIPQDEPWIALIERGKCYFFNKIRLAKMHNASAVIIYNDRPGSVQVMNTVGTSIISLMITKEDGHKISSLIHEASPLIMSIQAGPSHNTSFVVQSTSTIASATKADVHSTTTTDIKIVSPWNAKFFKFSTPKILPSIPTVDGVTVTPTGGGSSPTVSKLLYLILSVLNLVYCYHFFDR